MLMINYLTNWLEQTGRLMGGQIYYLYIFVLIGLVKGHML